MQLNEDKKTARKDQAMINGAVLRRFCLMMKQQDKKYTKKSMKQFKGISIYFSYGVKYTWIRYILGKL